MKRWILMFLAMALMQTAAAFAQDEPAAEGDVAQLIDQLDSEAFAEREAAAAQLTRLGRPAIEALSAAAQAESAEKRVRALGVLKSLYGADDLATKEAAKKAFETLSKSENENTRQAAEKILATPQFEIPAGIWLGAGKANVFGGVRPVILGGDGGVTITGAGIRIGDRGQLILARAGGGERRIDIIKGTGVGVLLLEGKVGIAVYVRQPQDKGDPQITRYLAKDADDLADKHPKIHKVYKALDVYRKNQTIIGGVQIDF